MKPVGKEPDTKPARRRATVPPGARSSAHPLQALIDGLPALISYVDARERYALVNRAYEDYSGRARREIIGRHVRELHGEEGYRQIEPHIAAAMRGEPVQFRLERRHATLGPRLYDVSLVPAPPAGDRRRRGFFVLATDITERTAHDDAARRRERHEAASALRQKDFALGSSLAGIAMCDLRGRLMLTNPACLRLWGYDHQGEVLGRHVLEFWSAPRRAVVAAKAVRNAGAWSGELTARRRDGSTFPALVNASTVFDEIRQPIGLMASFVDMSEQKQAEETLKSERNFTAAVLDTLGALVIVLDRVGRIVRFNKACEALTGYASSEVLGRVFWDFLLDPEEAPAVQEVFSSLAAGHFPNTHENDWIAKDGSRFRIAWSNSAITDSHGGVTHVIATGIDVTAQRGLEQRNRELMERQRALLDGIAERAWLKDAQGRYLAVNRRFAELAGLEPSQIVGRTAREVLGNERAALFDAEDREVMLTGRPLRAERPSFLSRGDTWFEVVKVPILDERGRAIGVAASTRDITDRKRLEASLRESEERMRLAQAFANVGAWDWNIPTGALYGSERIAPMLGYRGGEIRTTYEAFLRAVHPEDRPAVEAALEACVRNGTPCDIEHRVVWPDGTVRWLHERGAVARAPDGAPLHMHGLVQDVTDRRHSERERIERERRQRVTLIREVHHRIKNHLQGVTGLLRAQADRHPEVRGVMEQAIARVQSVALVHGLQGRTADSVVRLCDMVPAIAALAERAAGATEAIEIAVTVDRPVQIADSEAVAIALILNELIVNALKYGVPAAGPKVRITVAGGASAATVTILNPGQLDGERTGQAGSGTGIGLVRALLPETGAAFSLCNVPEGVEARIALVPPVLLPATAAR